MGIRPHQTCISLFNKRFGAAIQFLISIILPSIPQGPRMSPKNQLFSVLQSARRRARKATRRDGSRASTGRGMFETLEGRRLLAAKSFRQRRNCLTIEGLPLRLSGRLQNGNGSIQLPNKRRHRTRLTHFSLPMQPSLVPVVETGNQSFISEQKRSG